MIVQLLRAVVENGVYEVVILSIALAATIVIVFANAAGLDTEGKVDDIEPYQHEE